MEEFGAFVDRPLEGLAPGDETGSACAFVDHCGSDGLGEVILAGGASGIDQSGASHVAIGDLVAAEINRVITGQLLVDTLVEFAVGRIAGVEGEESTVIFRQFLFDDIGLDGDAQVVRLAGEVGCDMVVFFLGFEGGIPQVAPEDGGEAEFMGTGKGFGHFDDLAVAFFRAEVDGGTHRSGTHVVGLLDGTKHDLIELVRIGHELVVVDLDHKRNLVGVLAGHTAQNTESGGHRVTAALDGELDDVFGIKVVRVLREGGSAAVFDALVHRQDADVAASGEASGIEDPVQVVENPLVSIRLRINAVNEIPTGQVEAILRDRFTFMGEQVLGLVAKIFLYL